MCVLLETRVSQLNVGSIFDKVFRGWWQRVSNVEHGSRGCRIAISWDPNAFSVVVQELTEQVVHYHVQSISREIATNCSFVYVANDYITWEGPLERLKYT
ncbi:hypothetical protein Pint_18373 [Pistacia integerrima]|uniref:Uncharacterized protein n=1 Tax=Pistacia integerrima TaxID=434235 RepID=A0ACC0YUG3_9ROSI|nr:hypothetical protein Pint_18373 [Pistacia integerrima]